uniref:Uncharacterized protein n=1 Tax=Heterorhabditis bacteriophora TaxID=37862 RepID=A0A1I7WF86_HETBA
MWISVSLTNYSANLFCSQIKRVLSFDIYSRDDTTSLYKFLSSFLISLIPYRICT